VLKAIKSGPEGKQKCTQIQEWLNKGMQLINLGFNCFILVFTIQKHAKKTNTKMCTEMILLTMLYNNYTLCKF